MTIGERGVPDGLLAGTPPRENPWCIVVRQAEHDHTLNRTTIEQHGDFSQA